MQEFSACKVPFFAGAKPTLFPLTGEIRKILLVMRITAILLLVATLHVSAKGLGQEKISLAYSNASLDQVLTSIKTQANVSFFYRPQYVKGKVVTINVTNADLKTVLDLCLKNQELYYEIVGKTVAIRPVKSVPISIEGDSTVKSNGNGELFGRVITQDGEPLASANVIIKRTGYGTATNSNGQFTLKNVKKDDIIIVTYIGYAPFVIGIGEKTNLLVVMQVAANKLDEAVIQAYGKTTDRFRTGNISRITSDDISKQPVMNVLNALQGQTAGTVVTNTSGYASGIVKVEIRGRNTINPSFPSDPLYIVDGVPLTILDITNNDSYLGGARGAVQSGLLSPADGQSPFFNINPSDIESIEVLKDADATAIYGSRGANGVILITTKKAKAGKTKFEIKVYSGINEVIKNYKMLNTKEYVQMREEALLNDAFPIDISTAPDLFSWDTTRYTDWQKYAWGNVGKTFTSDVALSGGDTRTNFRLAANYDYRSEIMVSGGANKRGGMSLNLNHNSLNQRLKMTISAMYSHSFVNTINTPNVSTLAPNAPTIFNNKGKLNYLGWQPLDYLFPFAILLQPYDSKTNFINSSFSISYEILKGLKIRTDLGYNNSQSSQKQITPIASQNPLNNPTGRSSRGYTFVNNIIIEPQLEYERLIKKGKLSILIGGSYQKNSTSSAILNGNSFSNDVNINNLSAASNIFGNTLLGEYNYGAVFGRINYLLNNRYIVNLNARRDGSSKFGPGRQFGNFGSIGGAWIFSEENWVKTRLRALSFGKLRASYGSTGGDQIQPYSFLTRWQFNSQPYNGNQVLLPQRHTDSTLHWQTNRKMEVALAISFWNDNLNFELSWYRNRCNNQLVGFPTPNYTGFSSVTTNSPANVENSGWEFVARSNLLQTKKINWLLTGNVGINRNRLLDYPNLAQSPYASALVIGKSLNIEKILHFTGVDPATGLYTFEDRNKDGQTTINYTYGSIDDRYIIDKSPKFSGGLKNELSYKNWQLSFLFYFIKQIGRNIYSNIDAPGAIGINEPAEVLNRWQKPGDIAQFSKYTTMPGIDVNNYRTSDAIYTDASFIRLQNLSLSYSLPNSIIKKAGINNCRIYLQGQNLFVITKYKGADPEIQNFGMLPLARILTGGLSINF